MDNRETCQTLSDDAGLQVEWAPWGHVRRRPGRL